MGTTISALVKGYLDTGEEKYFEELLERFSPLIKAYARKLYYLEYDDSLGIKPCFVRSCQKDTISR